MVINAAMQFNNDILISYAAMFFSILEALYILTKINIITRFSSNSLKKTSAVLDEHEEALRKKLEMISLEQQTQL